MHHCYTHLSPTQQIVPPNTIMETVRLWLQEGLNGLKFERVVFTAFSSHKLVEECMHIYFPTETVTDTNHVPSSESAAQSQERTRESYASSDITSGSEEEGTSDGSDSKSEKSAGLQEEEEEKTVDSLQTTKVSSEETVQKRHHNAVPEPLQPEGEPQDASQQTSKSSEDEISGAPKPEEEKESKRWSTPMAVQLIPYASAQQSQPARQVSLTSLGGTRSPLDDIIMQLEKEGRAQDKDELKTEKTVEARPAEHIEGKQTTDTAVEDLERMIMGLQVLSDDLKQASSEAAREHSRRSRSQLHETPTENTPSGMENTEHTPDTSVHILNPSRTESDV